MKKLKLSQAKTFTKIQINYIFPVLAFLGIIFFTLGFHFNSYNPTMKAMFQGVLMDEPFLETYFICCLGFNFFWSWLFKSIPHFDWYSLTLVQFYFAQAILFLRLLPSLKLESKIFVFTPFFQKVFLLIAFLLPLHFLLDITLAACVLFVLVVFNILLINNSFFKKLILIALGIFSILLRHDAVLLEFIFLMPFLAFVLEIKLKQIIIKTLPFIVTFIVILLSIGLMHLQSNELYIKGEPLFYFVSDGDLRVPNTNLSEIDSIKVKAVEEYLLFDSKNIDLNYLKKISLTPLSFGLIKYLLLSYEKVLTHFSRSIAINYSMVFLWLAFTLKIFISRNIKYKLWLTYLIVFTALYILTAIIKMEGRILIPIVFIAIISSLVKIKIDNIYRNVILMIAFFVSLGTSVYDSIGLNKIESNNQQILNKIQSKFENKNIVVDATTSNIFNVGPFNGQKLTNSKFYTVDMGQLTLIPQYKIFLGSKCRCDVSNAKELFQFIESEKDKVIYISTKSRIDLVKEYLDLVYHYKLPFEKIENFENDNGYLFFSVSNSS